MATVKVLTITNGTDAPTYTVGGSIATVFIKVTGNLSGTLIYQVSRDKGVTFSTVYVYKQPTATVVNSSTTNDTYIMDVRGVDVIKVTTSAYTSGTTTLTISQSDLTISDILIAASGGGGGPVTIADGADVTQGSIADAAVGDAAGTVNAHI